MKKSVLLFALLAVAVGVRAQLVVHYDNPQRFQITEFEDHSSYDPLHMIGPHQMESTYQTIFDYLDIYRNVYLACKYERKESQRMVYGIAIPIDIHEYDTANVGYYHCNCKMPSERLRKVLEFYERYNCSVVIANVDEGNTNTYSQIKSRRIKIGTTSLIGNYFKMPDADTSVFHPHSSTLFPVLEVYFNEPQAVGEKFLVGVNLVPGQYRDPTTDSIIDECTSPLIIQKSVKQWNQHLYVGINNGSMTDDISYTACAQFDTNISMWGAPFPILTPAPCMAPIWMNVAEQHREGTTIGATIEWRGQYGNTSFEVEYGPQGFAEGTGTTVGPIAPDASRRGSVTINGLQMGSDYTVRVRALCNNSEAAGYTDWAEMDFHTDSRFIVNVSANDESLGFTTGGGEYAAGTTAQLFAYPRSNCPFRNWNDGNNQNPRTITVTKDTSIVAIFDCDTAGPGTTAIATADAGATPATASPNPTHGDMTVTAGSTITSLTLFDIQGRTVMEAAPMTESATLDLGTLRPAVYILKLTTAEGPQTLKIVKQ